MVKAPKTIEIGYARDCRTGNFIVTKLDSTFHANSKHRRQQICVLPGAFFRALPTIDRRSVANVIEISAIQAEDIGFIVPVETEVILHEVCA
ncbi:hypothetical protein [Paenibacillus wynnii]|uniref:Uncharacterized protein n=1 Tax=Paenibacillus wynnii TaxID=268407 RepID=A0A098MFJ6_9BACL|nr:hypothetical protein [Paenibacillus wynnii]KGE20808.1 hypothetical protein PWYN_01100 [Paenibacillus wynnii]